MSNYQAKFKHVAGTFLKEISINFIVIGQRHYGRVIVIPPRGKKVPEGEDMLAFYRTDVRDRVYFYSHTWQESLSVILALKRFLQVYRLQWFNCFKLKQRKL